MIQCSHTIVRVVWLKSACEISVKTSYTLYFTFRPQTVDLHSNCSYLKWNCETRSFTHTHTWSKQTQLE